MTVPTLPDHIGWLLVSAGQRWKDRFVLAMQANGYPDFTLSRANLLGAVSRFHGTRLVDLAARLGLTKQAVGQVVDDLEGAGYLKRVPDEKDGRAKRAVYTDKGLAMLTTADRVKGDIEDQLAKEIGGQSLTTLSDLLRRADAALDTEWRDSD
ncbi:MAG: MarR family winged helix-turn-helix transcriptional regulator [Pseudomonadota bacterium]